MKKPYAADHLLVSRLLIGTPASASGAVFAQEGTVSPSDAPLLLLQADVEDATLLRGRYLTCGDITTAGTPIAGNAVGNGNSGEITIAGIPAAASTFSARLYWTVLTNKPRPARPSVSTAVRSAKSYRW